ncbi:hypothetical protein MTE01_11990 [Microbacterium testaceum]|uniref:Uncharacterized protein n=1 Tax=Microbacterium testaceum TaxID=2033 RepID=A0A4Y3QJ42_MICTE|nr:hypothetical protein MTE01_11990 [Microbacterium testaceum]
MRISAHSAYRREETSAMRKVDVVHIDRMHLSAPPFPSNPVLQAGRSPFPGAVVVRCLGAELVTPLRGADCGP